MDFIKTKDAIKMLSRHNCIEDAVIELECILDKPESYLKMRAGMAASKWSNVRRSIHKLSIGHSVIFPLTEYNSANTNVQRLKDFYVGANWRVNKLTKTNRVMVTRTS